MNNTFFVGGVIMYYINDKVKNKFNNDDYFDGKEYVEKIKDAVKTDDIKRGKCKWSDPYRGSWKHGV